MGFNSGFKGLMTRLHCGRQSIYFFRYSIYLTAIGLTPGGSSTVHIYTQTIHRTIQLTTGQYN